MDDDRPADPTASDRLGDLLRDPEAVPAGPPAPGTPVPPRPGASRAGTPRAPAFRGDAAFRDDRFDDPRDRAAYGDARPVSLEDELRGDDIRPLADAGTRLVAQLLDGLAFAVAVVPALVLAGIGGAIGGESVAMGLGVIGALVGLIGLVVYQARLLGSKGQTIGKRAMKLRIVDAADGSNPGIGRAFWTRYVANGMISGIPYLGSLYSLVDVLFIFREDRRCVHDHLAQTIVVTEAHSARAQTAGTHSVGTRR